MKPVMQPSRRITRIAVQRGQNDVTVVIYGDGVLPYRVFSVGSNQLRVDFPHVVTSLSFGVLSVEHRLLQDIRIGHHVDKLRLLFVMNAPVRYAVKAQGNILAIRLKGR